MTVHTALEKLTESLKSFYNIDLNSEIPGVAARADYFEHSEQFLVSRKANLWTADGEEFMYILTADHLTREFVDSSMEQIGSDWKKHAHIGPGHMYTYVTPVFLCQSADKDALKAIRRFRRYKSYRLGFYGWSEFHAAAYVCDQDSACSNGSGRGVKKMLLKVLES